MFGAPTDKDCTEMTRALMNMQRTSYRGTSLMRNTPLLGPYRRTMHRVLCPMVVLRGGAVSYERGTPVLQGTSRPSAAAQGYFAHKKQPPPVGPPYCPGHSPTAGSSGGVVSYERGTPVMMWGLFSYGRGTLVLQGTSHPAGSTSAPTARTASVPYILHPAPYTLTPNPTP
jgi:hypothetical protein